MCVYIHWKQVASRTRERLVYASSGVVLLCIYVEQKEIKLGAYIAPIVYVPALYFGPSIISVHLIYYVLELRLIIYVLHCLDTVEYNAVFKLADRRALSFLWEYSY